MKATKKKLSELLNKHKDIDDVVDEFMGPVKETAIGNFCVLFLMMGSTLIATVIDILNFYCSDKEELVVIQKKIKKRSRKNI